MNSNTRINGGASHKDSAGFGLIEALASMFILALMFTGVCMMNYSNHQAALRIATRTEAISIGNRVMDSLQALGVSQVDTVWKGDTVMGDTMKTTGSGFSHQYRVAFKGTQIIDSEGIVGHMRAHIRAVKVDDTVKWTLNDHENFIVLNGIVQ